jgi:hypothetical protein
METKRPIDDTDKVKLPTDELLNIVTTIFKDKGNEKDKKRKYQREYGSFIESYPTLFEMVCKKDFDFDRFKHMIMLKQSVEEGKLSQHDASVKVGSVLYDAYVKDKISAIPPKKE